MAVHACTTDIPKPALQSYSYILLCVLDLPTLLHILPRQAGAYAMHFEF